MRIQSYSKNSEIMELHRRKPVQHSSKKGVLMKMKIVRNIHKNMI